MRGDDEGDEGAEEPPEVLERHREFQKLRQDAKRVLHAHDDAPQGVASLLTEAPAPSADSGKRRRARVR